MPRRLRSILFPISFIILSVPLLATAQTPTTQPTLSEILDNARRESLKYVDTFKNLLSEEFKTVEIYDKKGGVKKKTAVNSTFIVYQLTKDQNQVVEFRNVLSVDGKPVADADRRAQDFFMKVVKAETSRKEIEQLKKESSRYDGDLVISGMTLFQSPVLSDKLRPFFDFKLVDERVIDGADVYEIAYQQTKQTPFIMINAKGEAEPGQTSIDFDIDSDAGKDLNGRLRGTLWIDASTFQVRREHRELTVQPGGTASPEPAIVNDFDFQNSDFGILTPSRITHVQSRVKSKGEPPVKEIGVTMEYSNFSKPDVEVKSSEVKSPKQ
jgi:hypothetical protein